MTDHEKSEYIYREMSRIGLNLDQLVSCGIDFDQSILSMPPEAKSRYEEYLEGLSKKYSTKKEKGDVLENIANCLMFTEFSIFNVLRNVRTSSNEIDILVSTSDKGKLIIPNLYTFLGDKFVCECKNYAKKLDVTYVGKFYSLLKTLNLELGIIFTVEGITGKNNWDASKAFIRKVALKEGIAIVVFDRNDYQTKISGDTSASATVVSSSDIFSVSEDFSVAMSVTSAKESSEDCEDCTVLSGTESTSVLLELQAPIIAIRATAIMMRGAFFFFLTFSVPSVLTLFFILILSLSKLHCMLISKLINYHHQLCTLSRSEFGQNSADFL